MTTLNRFTTFITNWWADFRWAALFRPALFALSLLVILSCTDDTGEVGFKNPNGDFQVFVKEFTIPSTTYVMDSVSTSYGGLVTGAKTITPNRVMVGIATDPVFGRNEATAYTQFYASTFPYVASNAVFSSIKLKLLFDYYWYGSDAVNTKQIFQVYELKDSIVSYVPHYINEKQTLGPLLGQTTYSVDPGKFSTNIITNADPNTTADQLTTDTLVMNLDIDYGQKIFNLAMDTVGTNEDKFNVFSKFRRQIPGIAIKSPNSDKIVGFDIDNLSSQIVLTYRIDTAHYTLTFFFSPSGQANGTAEYMSYTQIDSDRSGTPLAALPPKYQDWQPASGMRYMQAGTGIVTKLDFTEVFDHFKDIPIKALSVAELRIQTDKQALAPLAFIMRAIKPDNRDVSTASTVIDVVHDPQVAVDGDIVGKHNISTRADGGWGSPFYKAEPNGDDGSVFLLGQTADDAGLYTGYLTSYLQNELALTDADRFRYYALIPRSPDMSRGLNGIYFPADNLKLKIYYTTPGIKKQ